MNAPLPRAALAGIALSEPVSEHPVARFRIRRRSMNLFEVVRTCSGPGVSAADAEPWVSEPLQGEQAANAFLARALIRFPEANPGWVALGEPWPETGRRPGQVYGGLPRDRDDEHRLDSAALGIVARA